VVTADAAHTYRETAEYIAGSKDDGNRESDYFLFVKGNQPSLQLAIKQYRRQRLGDLQGLVSYPERSSCTRTSASLCSRSFVAVSNVTGPVRASSRR
jgi:hypothetical protein